MEFISDNAFPTEIEASGADTSQPSQERDSFTLNPRRNTETHTPGANDLKPSFQKMSSEEPSQLRKLNAKKDQISKQLMTPQTKTTRKQKPHHSSNPVPDQSAAFMDKSALMEKFSKQKKAEKKLQDFKKKEEKKIQKQIKEGDKKQSMLDRIFKKNEAASVTSSTASL
jgi:hypothetical protein